jgi:hypothetical protein
MRKSCAQFVYSMLALCGRTHGLYAPLLAMSVWGGYYLAVIPRVSRSHAGRFYTAIHTHFISVICLVVPTIHMTNNNYNFLYIPI